MWPRCEKYRERYRVQDLIPATSYLRTLFIAESPHKDEVSSANAEERSPFRGTAGREWWGALSRIAGEQPIVRDIPSREGLLKICAELGIGVLNAVQYPLDPKITLHQGSACDPVQFLGFQKSSGPYGYKAVLKKAAVSEHPKQNPVKSAILDLRSRLKRVNQSHRVGKVVCLGNDSKWFVERALAVDQEIQIIPHPSSWWRKAEYRSRALKLLEELLR